MKKLKRTTENRSNKQIIDRFILHPKLEIYSRREPPPSLTDPIHVSKNEIFESIGRAKNFLIKEKNFKKGDRVIMTTLFWPEFIVWFFAVSELGGSFLVTDSPAESTINVFKHRLDIYRKIDHIISGNVKFPAAELVMEKITFDEKIYQEYEFSQEAMDTIWAEETDILMYALSSGTTDTPKIIFHTHSFFYKLMDRNAEVFNLKSDDRCLHSKNLHHGSVVGVYLLPTLKHCKYHVFQSFGPETSWTISYIDILQKYKINRCLVYWSHLLQELCSRINPSDFDYAINIGILTKIDKRNIDYLCGACGHNLISIFGCTETSGPLFLQKISKENYENYHTSNFQKPLDDFYKIELLERILHVTMPDGTLISTGDHFEIVDGHYHYIGREGGLKINGTPIYVPLIANAVEKFFAQVHNLENKQGDFFDLVIDCKKSRIYMRSSIPIDLKLLNKFLFNEFNTHDYAISSLVIGSRKRYIHGIKLDATRIRYESRKNLKIT
jgi:hypothetical protein